MPAAANEDRFWSVAAPLLEQPGVTCSTMMGLPCVRINGAFFASFDRKTGALLVKLPEPVVDQLIERGQAEPFAPAGGRFRQWAAIPPARSSAWTTLLDEALQHVSSLPRSNTRTR